jgi:ParB-like nuclease domain
MPRDEAGAIGRIGWRPTEVHPLAALFPMMADDELAELAEDILTNGLIQPIVVDADGVLIDGRNRLAACEIAGVAPIYQKLNGHDAAAFIVSANLARRNLSKGQQAMALAMIYPDGKQGVKSLNISRSEQVLLSQARTILRHSTELAQDVLRRGTHFDVALKTVLAETQARKAHDAQMALLLDWAPDVAAMVTDGRLTLDEGMKQLGELQKAVRQRVEHGKAAAARIGDVVAHVLTITAAAALTDRELAMVGHQRHETNPLADLSRPDLERMQESLARLIALHDGETVEDVP